MHHPREAVIDGVQFVLIREDLLEEVKDVLGGFKTWHPDSLGVENYDLICGLCGKLGEL